MDKALEKEYIDRACRGDTSAFEVLCRENERLVMSVCLSYMKNEHDAEDACQETFIKLWRFIPRFKGDSALSTYLYTIAKNTCLDAIKKSSRNIGDELLSNIADSAPTPEENYIKKEFREELYLALTSLDTDAREILLLREKAGLEYKEIAQMLSLPEGTVKSRIARAREKLLSKLKEKM